MYSEQWFRLRNIFQNQILLIPKHILFPSSGESNYHPQGCVFQNLQSSYQQIVVLTFYSQQEATLYANTCHIHY